MDGLPAGYKFPEHGPMKPLPVKSLLLVSTLFTPLLPAQDPPAKIHEIEQKVLQKQHQEAVLALVESAGEGRDSKTGANADLIGKRVQWLTLVGNQLEPGSKTSAANQEEMTKSAGTLNDLAWDMITSPDAGARHPETGLKLAAIALELGGENWPLKPNALDTKARALFLLGKHGEAITEQEKAIAAATVENDKAGFEATLAAYRRDELPEVSPPAQAIPEATEPLNGTAYILDKLRRIVIPVVDFENTSLEEAVDFLRLRAKELDAAELDPSRKGINFVIRRPRLKPASASGTTSGPGSPQPAADPGTLRIGELRLRNVPLAVALKYICDATRLRYKVDDFAVTLVPVDEPEDLFTRTFRVPLDFYIKLDSASGTNTAPGTARPPVIELLKAFGINFGEGSSASLASPGLLMTTNKPSELDKIEQLIQAIQAEDDSERAKRSAPARPRATPAVPGER